MLFLVNFCWPNIVVGGASNSFLPPQSQQRHDAQALRAQQLNAEVEGLTQALGAKEDINALLQEERCGCVIECVCIEGVSFEVTILNFHRCVSNVQEPLLFFIKFFL